MTNKRGLFWSVAALSLAAIISPARADDSKEAVRAVAKDYAAAVAAHDTDKMRALVSSNSTDLVNALIGLLSKYKVLDDASQAKFNTKISPASQTESYAGLDSADIQITHDTAVVTPPKVDGKMSKPITLKNENGSWKVDITAAIHNRDGVIKMFGIAGEVAASTAQEITDGKYNSAEDAKNAYYDNVKKAYQQATMPKQ